MTARGVVVTRRVERQRVQTRSTGEYIVRYGRKRVNRHRARTGTTAAKRNGGGHERYARARGGLRSYARRAVSATDQSTR